MKLKIIFVMAIFIFVSESLEAKYFKLLDSHLSSINSFNRSFVKSSTSRSKKYNSSSYRNSSRSQSSTSRYKSNSSQKENNIKSNNYKDKNTPTTTKQYYSTKETSTKPKSNKDQNDSTTPKLSNQNAITHTNTKNNLNQGKTFETKEQAIQSFKNDHKETYTSRYEKEPLKRPDFIPTKTNVNGRSYNVSFNRTHRSYGYFGPSGSWVMYDPFTDSVITNRLMSRHSYHYGSRGIATRTYFYSSFNGVIFLVISFIIIVVFLVVGISYFKRPKY